MMKRLTTRAPRRKSGLAAPHVRTIATLLGATLVFGLSIPARGRAPSKTIADSSVVEIAGPSEPGTRLIVTGRILKHDGRTPAARERIGVYHTDATGQYGVHPTRSSYPGRRDARLSGWLVSDAAGRFEIRTIRPGPYGPGAAAHIHFIMGGRGDYELLFADDPAAGLGGAGSAEASHVQVRPVQKDKDGTERVTVDWRLP